MNLLVACPICGHEQLDKGGKCESCGSWFTRPLRDGLKPKAAEALKRESWLDAYVKLGV